MYLLACELHLSSRLIQMMYFGQRHTVLHLKTLSSLA